MKQYNSVQKRALKKCIEAETLIHTARKKKNNPELILQAMDIYQEILTTDDLKLAEPFIGIAYLMFSMGKVIPALKILRSAMELEPQNKRVNSLYQQIEKTQKAQNVSFDQAAKKLEEKNRLLQQQNLQLKRNVGEIKETKAPKPIPQKSISMEGLPEQIEQTLGLRPPAINQGPQVKLLQVLLQTLEYDRVTITQQYDRLTFIAVRAFQSDHNLKLTGLVNEETQQVLNQKLRELNQQS